MCGICCRELDVDQMTMMPSDYRRWKRQGRQDILRHAIVMTPQGYGDLNLLFDMEKEKYLRYCQFLKRVGRGKYICTIHDTKPKVCKEFWCEWSYGVGEKGTPFKTDCGWEEKARELGYGETEKYNDCES